MSKTQIPSPKACKLQRNITVTLYFRVGFVSKQACLNFLFCKVYFYQCQLHKALERIPCSHIKWEFIFQSIQISEFKAACLQGEPFTFASVYLLGVVHCAVCWECGNNKNTLFPS